MYALSLPKPVLLLQLTRILNMMTGQNSPSHMRSPNPSRYHCLKNSSWVQSSKRKISPKAFPRPGKLACVASLLNRLSKFFSQVLLMIFLSLFSLCGDCSCQEVRL